MSVINTMLKRLDERGAAAASGGAAPFSGTARKPNPKPKPKPKPKAAGWRMPALVLVGGGAIATTAFTDWAPLVQAATGPHAPAAVVQAEPPAPALASTLAPTFEVSRASTPVMAINKTRLPPPVKVAAIAPPRSAGSLPALALPPSLAAPVPTPARIDKRSLALTAEQQVLTLHRAATELAQAGQRRAALERAHAALALDAGHAPSRLLAAVLEHEAGASERAAALLRDGLALQPRDAQQALLLARLQVAQGHQAEALGTLERHAVAGADAEGLRGGILAQQGEFKRSMDAYENAARQQPANPMWWLGLGVALESEGQGGRAKQAYARAQALGLARDDLATYVDQRLRALD